MSGAGPAETALIAVEAAGYAATLSAAGAVWFLAYTPGAPPARVVPRERALIVVALAAAAIEVPAVSAVLNGAADMWDPDLLRMLLQGHAGYGLAQRLAGLLLMLTLRADGRPPRLAALCGSVAAATSFAWVGHVHALGSIATAVLIVHLLCVTFWLGALMPLFSLVGEFEPRRAGAAAARFGSVAMAVVGLLLAAGAALLCVLLRSVDELWTTGYGRTVSCKLLGVACLLALAALNRRRLTPRLQAGDAGAPALLRDSIRAEIVIAVLILIATATMTTLEGPAGGE